MESKSQDSSGASKSVYPSATVSSLLDSASISWTQRRKPIPPPTTDPFLFNEPLTSSAAGSADLQPEEFIQTQPSGSHSSSHEPLVSQSRITQFVSQASQPPSFVAPCRPTLQLPQSQPHSSSSLSSTTSSSTQPPPSALTGAHWTAASIPTLVNPAIGVQPISSYTSSTIVPPSVSVFMPTNVSSQTSSNTAPAHSAFDTTMTDAPTSFAEYQQGNRPQQMATVSFQLPSGANVTSGVQSNSASVVSNNGIISAGNIANCNSSTNNLMNVPIIDRSNRDMPPAPQPLSSEERERVIEVSPNGRYAKINILLGKGAHKVVYKAIDREEGYEVAWNCFQTTKAEYNELSSEIEILKRVRHPNIINFHDCWYNNGEFIFVTELMTSGTLREYIRKLQIPNMKIVKRWCRQILKGLLYLHSHNPPIIHRDIKCDNIFINGAHGEVKIGDMGTAEMKMGKKYTVIGTPEFMAPEMYEEKGYNEKVDVYAFGMCLLEMVTGEYPYSECTNAAQIYRKVVQGIKPESLQHVTDQEVSDLIKKCICEETVRLSVSMALEHSFLSVEPEVVLLSSNENKNHLTLQVVFKGLDKLSAKFEFNTETDTAEEVVNEMIEENVLPLKYQTLITHEINRILRDLNKLTESKEDKDEKAPWRRSDAVKDELERAKRDLKAITERALEAEKKAELLEVRAKLAEEKNKSMDSNQPQMATTTSSQSQPPISGYFGSFQQQSNQNLISTESGNAVSESSNRVGVEDVAQPLKEYRDEQPIEDLVRDVALANNRGQDKATEWLNRLQAQDVMTVGDLRDLHDADWSSLGLTVFASRALRNALHGKVVRNNISPKNSSRSLITTPPITSGPSGPSVDVVGSSHEVSRTVSRENEVPKSSMGFNQSPGRNPIPPKPGIPDRIDGPETTLDSLANAALSVFPATSNTFDSLSSDEPMLRAENRTATGLAIGVLGGQPSSSESNYIHSVQYHTESVDLASGSSSQVYATRTSQPSKPTVHEFR